MIIWFDQNYQLPSEIGLDLEQGPTFPSQVIDPVTKWHAETNENKIWYLNLNLYLKCATFNIDSNDMEIPWCKQTVKVTTCMATVPVD